MAENTHGSGRHVLGDLTNVIRKRAATSDLEKSTGGIKIRRIEKTGTRKEYDANAKASSIGKGIVFGHLFDDVAREKFQSHSIFQNSRVQHIAAEAAGLLSKETNDSKNHYASIGPLDLSDKEQDSSLESEDDYDDEDNDETNGELLHHFFSSELANKTSTNDGECLTQEEIVGSSGNQKPLSSLDATTGGDLPISSAQHASVRTGGLEEAVAPKSCACSFCLKAAFMWMDLHYQDARSRLSVLKKSIKFARSLEEKCRGNEYAANVAGYESKRAVGVEFELSQQQRSLFLYTENALVRESTQLLPSICTCDYSIKQCAWQSVEHTSAFTC